MRAKLACLILYGLYFLLLAVGWLVAPEAWRGAIFFVTYVSATGAISTLTHLIDRQM